MKKKFNGLKDEAGCVLCPKCENLFSIRKQGGCPLCGTRLVYPGEFFSPGGEGYFFAHSEWHQISEAGKHNQEVVQK